MRITIGRLKRLIKEVGVPASESDYVQAAVEIFNAAGGGYVEEEDIDRYVVEHPELVFDADRLLMYVDLEYDRARMKW